MKKKRKNETKADWLFLLIGTVCLLVFCITGIMLFHYYSQYQRQEAVVDDITMLRQMDLTSRMEMPADNGTNQGLWDAPDIDLQLQRNNCRLLEANEDYKAWISIPGTKISYPVVQRDNDYYLYRDFFGANDSHGTIFLDETCDIRDDVVLFHGHHMKDGTMFAGLKGYKVKEFRQEHPYIYLDWGFGDTEYQVFAVALVDLTVEDYFAFDKLPMDEKEKAAYLKRFKNHSLWYQNPEDITGQIVLLSTCEYGTDEQRLVVAAIATGK